MDLKKLSLILLFIVIAAVQMVGQATSGITVDAVLQYHVDLASPPSSIFAVCVADQKLSNGSIVVQGTKFIGKLEDVNASIKQIKFHTIQIPNGNKESFSGKTILGDDEENNVSGVSSKVGDTIHSNAQSTVLGAIFNRSGSKSVRPVGNVLPRGTKISIAIN